MEAINSLTLDASYSSTEETSYSNSDNCISCSEDEESTGSNVSRLITEEDYIDCIFSTCDVDGKGYVPASKLIAYLHFTTSNIPENEEVDDLCDSLDPDHKDEDIDAATFRDKFDKWVSLIRRHSESDCTTNEEIVEFCTSDILTTDDINFVEASVPTNLESTTDVALIDLSVSCNNAASQYMLRNNCNLLDIQERYHSLQKENQDLKLKLQHSEEQSKHLAIDMEMAKAKAKSLETDMNLKLNNVQFHNKKISDENKNLLIQLDNTEEVINNLNNEIEESSRKVLSLKRTLDKVSRLEADNGELRRNLWNMSDSYAALESQMAKAVQDKISLKQKAYDFEDELKQTQHDMEEMLNEKDQLSNLLAEQKLLRVKAEELNYIRATQILENQSEMDSLQETIHDMTKILMATNKDKTDVEEQLRDTKQNLETHRQKWGKSVNLYTREKFLLPKCFLLPAENSSASDSLCMELKNVLVDNDTLPTPLCDKEYAHVLAVRTFDATNSDHIFVDQKLEQEIEDLIKTSQSRDKKSSKASKISSEYNDRKEVVLDHVNYLARMAPRKESSPRGRHQLLSPTDVRHTLRIEINKFADKIATLATAKQASETRIKKLCGALVRMKDYNSSVRSSCEALMYKCEHDSQTAVGQMTVELAASEKELSAQIATNEIMAKQTRDKEETVAMLTKQCDLSKTAQERIQNECDSLKSANFELAEKYYRCEEQINEYQLDLERTTAEFEKEKDRANKLQEYRDSNGESLYRQQLTKEIEDLRSKLAASQTALNNLQLQGLRCTDDDDGYSWIAGDNQGSPLLDALTLDFGAEQPHYVQGLKCTSTSADTILESHEPTYYNADNRELTQSCPLLSSKQVTISTQTEDFSPALNNTSNTMLTQQRQRPPVIASSKYATVNVSTGSSTSGVVDMDISSCSNKSEPGTVYCGRNFLLADPGAVDYEDMSDPLSRQRSTSFKRAIERGFSGESNLSYETVEPATSPETPDLPPYQCTPGLPTGLPPYIEPPAFRHNTVPDLLHPYCTDDNLATTQANATYMCSTNSNLPLSTPTISVDDPSTPGLTTNITVTDYGATSWTDYTTSGSGAVTTSPEDPAQRTVAEVYNQECDASGLLDTENSPLTARRLSTLVEEEMSDVESLASHNSLKMALSPGNKKTLPCSIQEGTMAPPPYHATQRFPSPLTLQDREPSTTVPHQVPPTYRYPPEYKKCDPQKTDYSMSTTVAPEHHMVPHACTDSTIHDISKDRTRISKRVDNSEEESRVLELASRDLGEVPLSEEDKLLNCKLIEEAERLSQTHNRHRTRRSRTSSVELSRSQTFDDSDGDDVFLSPTLQSPSIPRNEMPQSYFTPERTISTQDSSLASERTSVTSALHGSSNSTTIPVTCNTQAPSLDRSVPPRESGATPSDKDYTHQGSDGVTSSSVNHLTHHHSPQQLNQIKEENLAKKRNLVKQSKMPELAESSETESMRGNGGSEHSEQDGAHKESNGVPDNHQDKMPSNEEEDPLAFPSLPNKVLRKMGLEAKSTENGEDEVLSDQEIEEKYSSLALAFKTDSLTLNKRISLQERSRDVAEQNIDTELKGLKDTLKTLGPFCNDQHSRDIYGKIQSHLDILEQSTTRMSSRAEVHGAVQQELRMSKAIDVMITHVDNLKRLYEKEHSELEETRKLLHGTKLGGVNGTEPGTEGVLHKRSFSMAPGTGVKFTGRRRASVAAFPQAFPRRTSLLAMTNMNINQTLDSNNDVRSRLEACTPGDITTTTTTTTSNSVDSVTLLEQQTPSSSQITPSHTPPIVYSSPPLRRRASTIDKHFSNNYDNTSTQLQNLSDRLSDFERERTQDPARLSPRRSTSSPAGMMESSQSSGSNNNNLTVNGHGSNSSNGAGGTNEEEKNSNDEEHIFQNGYEEGVRAHVSQDIEELREQQRDFQENLDVLMEQNSTTSDTYISAATTFVSNNYLTRLLLWWPTIWQRHKLQNHVRTTLAGIVLLMALLSFLFTFLPRTHADIRRFAYESIPWESVERILEPYTDKHHHDPPPV